jgi:hypothetical protein
MKEKTARFLAVLLTAMALTLGLMVPTGTAHGATSGWGLLIADNANRRLVITDLNGNVVWQMANPTGRTSASAGPLGVRWLTDGKILATFGTGEVGVIDVTTKTWDWKTSGYNKDWFQSPYDAQLLPDGNLAVATRFNEGGRVVVYNRSTGAVVWKHLVNNAHSLIYRTPTESYNTTKPTLIVGGWSGIREVTYEPGVTPRVVWSYRSEYTHDVMPLADGTMLTAEGYYIQKISRTSQVWRHNTPQEARRFAPNPSGGFILSMAHSDRIEFRNDAGQLQRTFGTLSDGTRLDYPYGIRLIDLAQVR